MSAIRFKNESSRAIPDELLNAVVAGVVSYKDINKILDDYNLKVKEYEIEFGSNHKAVKEIFVIGDING